ncbi:MAG: hypothetical protein LBQ95_04995 [Lachnospiraceae bacterium]|jgi:hypothetical protein|nr:hypothetical protein [Lachnospiraceae bacterium]
MSNKDQIKEQIIGLIDDIETAASAGDGATVIKKRSALSKLMEFIGWVVFLLILARVAYGLYVYFKERK